MINFKDNIFARVKPGEIVKTGDENLLKADMIINDLYFNIFEPRKLLISTNRYPNLILKPIGRKIFENKSKTTGVPVDMIIDQSIKKFGKEYFHKIKIEV